MLYLERVERAQLMKVPSTSERCLFADEKRFSKDICGELEAF